MNRNLRQRLWILLEPDEGTSRASQLFDIALVTLILANVACFVVGTVPEIEQKHAHALEAFELVSVLVFTAEYMLRIVACTASPLYSSTIRGRIRYALTPLALIDLLAIAPAYLPMIGVDLRVLRMFRVLRLARLLKLGRYSESLRIIHRVILKKKEDLAATLFVVVVLLILSSSIVYFAESEAQPETFGSIPQCMWWGVATLTTVGYGDAFPITPIGKVIGSISAILGIGLFALPTAILGSAFIEELDAKRSSKSSSSTGEDSRCPHCGRPSDGD